LLKQPVYRREPAVANFERPDHPKPR